MIVVLDDCPRQPKSDGGVKLVECLGGFGVDVFHTVGFIHEDAGPGEIAEISDVAQGRVETGQYWMGI